MTKSHVMLSRMQIGISNPMSMVFITLMVAMRCRILRKKQSWTLYMNLTVRCILRNLGSGEVISIKKIDGREDTRIYSFSRRIKQWSGLIPGFADLTLISIIVVALVAGICGL